MNKFLVSEAAPWFLLGMLGIVLLTFIASLPTLLKSLKHLNKSVVILFICTLIIGAYIRFAWVPNTHRIYFDEDRYLMYAVSFARTGQALGIEIATPDTILKGDPDPGARVTVPLIHAIVLKLLGYKDANLFATAKALSTLQIALVFIYVFMLFKRPIGALFASMFMALLPITVFWSVTTNLDSIFVLFGLLTGIASILYANKTSLTTSAFLFASFSLLLFVRIEGILFLPIILLTVHTLRTQASQKRITSKDSGFIFSTAILLLLRLIVGLPLFTKTWCCAEATPLEIFQTGYFIRNTIPNLQTLFIQPEFPFMITVLAFVGIAAGLISLYANSSGLAVARTRILILWIIEYFFLYSFYYAGVFYSFTFSGSYGRFFLMLVPPFVILASLTLDACVTLFQKSSYKQKTTILTITTVCLFTLFPTILNYRTYIRISPWDNLVDAGPRIIRAFMTDDVLPTIKPPAVIIHPLTAVVLMHGYSAVSLEAFIMHKQARDFVETQLKKGIPTYIMDTSFCDQSPYKCKEIQETFTFIPYHVSQKAEEQGFAVKEVQLKKSNL
jgi:hypothetical protein